MSATVCLSANTLAYVKGVEGGGHLWAYLNLALGLRSLGYRAIWLEVARASWPGNETKGYVAALKSHLERYGLAESVALCSWTGESLPRGVAEKCLDFEAAVEADLLLNVQYGLPHEVVGRFRRSALIDIDMGLLLIRVSKRWIGVARHDADFALGETVGQPGARFRGVGPERQYTPRCVALNWRPAHGAGRDVSSTAVSHRRLGERMEDVGKLYGRNVV